MTLALTAYPSSANGTSSGKSSTSPGNIFLAAYSDSNAYQRWKFIDENGAYAYADRGLSNGVYYINHIDSGKFLRRSNNSLDGISGYVDELGNAVRWRFTLIGDMQYVIQPISDLSKYLMVSSSSSTSPSLGSISNLNLIPDNCKWKISGMQIRNVKTSKYLYVYKNSSSQYSVGLTSASSALTKWAVIQIDSYESRELQDFAITDSIELYLGESYQFNMTKSPSDALWADSSYFVYGPPQYGRVSITDNGTITALAAGTDSILVTHKVTGASFTVTVNLYNTYSWGISVQNAYPSTCEMYGDEGNGNYASFGFYADNLISGFNNMMRLKFDYRGTDSWSNDFKSKNIPGATHTYLNIDDVDFMVYVGHGYAKNRNKEEGLFQYNSLHFGTMNSVECHPEGNGTVANANFTTQDALYFGYQARTKWLLTYTCNFLNTAQNDPNVMHMLDNGGRLILGLGSKSFVVAKEGMDFGHYLTEGYTFEEAYFQAAQDNQDTLNIVADPNSHRYSILYYGPENRGTLLDKITEPLNDVEKTEGKLKFLDVHFPAILPLEEY